jgi:hypothetical protein
MELTTERGLEVFRHVAPLVATFGVGLGIGIVWAASSLQPTCVPALEPVTCEMLSQFERRAMLGIVGGAALLLGAMVVESEVMNDE